VLAQKGKALLGETRALVEAVRALENIDELLGLDVPVGMPAQLEQLAHRAFRKAAPSLRWRLRYTNGDFDPETDAKLVVFMGPKPPTDPRWQKTRMVRVRTGLFAASEYLEEKGAPSSLEELTEHRLLLWEQPGRSVDTLPLGQKDEFPIRPSVVSPSALLVRRLAQAGDGICYAPASKLAGLLGSEESLDPVLKNLVRGEVDMWMAVRSEVSAGAIGLVAGALRGFAKAALSPIE
jgi:DNA-binding transcriptional LysR family regulator